MKTRAFLFGILLALPLAAVACPMGMQQHGNGCVVPAYNQADYFQGRRDYIDSIGDGRDRLTPRDNGRVRSPEEMAYLERLRLKAEKEKKIKREELAKGQWSFESTATPGGRLCLAVFSKHTNEDGGKSGGMVTIMGFQQPNKDAWLIFSGTGLPKPRNVVKLKMTLEQDDNHLQTIPVFNYREPRLHEIGTVAFAVPGLAAGLEGMRDKQSFKLSLDGATLMTIQWDKGATVMQKLKQCAA